MAAKVSSLLPVTPYIDKTRTFRCQSARCASVVVQKSGPPPRWPLGAFAWDDYDDDPRLRDYPRCAAKYCWDDEETVADELTPAEQHQLDILKAQMVRGLSKNQRLTELCREIDAHDGCGG